MTGQAGREAASDGGVESSTASWHAACFWWGARKQRWGARRPRRTGLSGVRLSRGRVRGRARRVPRTDGTGRPARGLDSCLLDRQKGRLLGGTTEQSQNAGEAEGRGAEGWCAVFHVRTGVRAGGAVCVGAQVGTEQAADLARGLLLLRVPPLVPAYTCPCLPPSTLCFPPFAPRHRHGAAFVACSCLGVGACAPCGGPTKGEGNAPRAGPSTGAGELSTLD